MRRGGKRTIGDRWKIHKAETGWHWEHRAANGHLIGASIKVYASRRSCIQNAISNGLQMHHSIEGFVEERHHVPLKRRCRSGTRRKQGNRLKDMRTNCDRVPPVYWPKPKRERHTTGFREPCYAPGFHSKPARRICVYILESSRNGALYVRVAHDLTSHALGWPDSRISDVMSVDGATRIVWFEFHNTIEEAVARQESIRNLPRQCKINLIEAANPNWMDLSGHLRRK